MVLIQWFSTFLLLWPLIQFLLVWWPPAMNLFSLLLHNCSFAIVMNCNVSIWYAGCLLCDPRSFCLSETIYDKEFFFFFFFFFFLVFWDRVSLCSPGCPGTHSVDQTGLELRNPPASASQVLRLKVCATTPGLTRNSLLLIFCLLFFF
jgi:hypothetical protein